MRKVRVSRKVRENLIGYSFISIWIIGLLVFMIYPLLMSIYYSFSDVRILGTGISVEFHGFTNFTNLFKLEEGFVFIELLISFVKELVLQVPIIIIFSVLIAVLLNQKIKGRGFFRSIFFLPVIIASGPVISELISQGAGGANVFETYGFIQIIEQSLNPQIAEPIINVFSQIIIIFWFSGVQILIFLAGLQKVDGQIYEAAKVDGAGAWETFWKITLPTLRNLIFVNFIYTIVLLSTFSDNIVIQSIKSNMFNQRPGTGYGFATAMSWVYFLVIMTLIGIVVIIFRPSDMKTKRGRR